MLPAFCLVLAENAVARLQTEQSLSLSWITSIVQEKTWKTNQPAFVAQLHQTERDNQLTKTFLAAVTIEPPAVVLHQEFMELEQYRRRMAACPAQHAHKLPKPCFNYLQPSEPAPEAPHTPPMGTSSHIATHTPMNPVATQLKQEHAKLSTGKLTHPDEDDCMLACSTLGGGSKVSNGEAGQGLTSFHPSLPSSQQLPVSTSRSGA